MKLTTPPSARRRDARDRDLGGGAGATSSRRSASRRSGSTSRRSASGSTSASRRSRRRRCAAALRARRRAGRPVRRAEARAQEPRGLVRALALLAGPRRDARAARARRPRTRRELRALADELGVARPRPLPRLDHRGASSRGCTRWPTCSCCRRSRRGSGCPILEAMGRGVPVACSNVSSLPEVAGDAAELFDPRGSGESIAAAVERLLADARAARRARRARPSAARDVHLGADGRGHARDATGARSRSAARRLMARVRSVAFNALFLDPGRVGRHRDLPARARAGARRRAGRISSSPSLTTRRGARALRDGGLDGLRSGRRAARPTRAGGCAGSGAEQAARAVPRAARRGRRRALARQHRAARVARPARADRPRRDVLHDRRAPAGERVRASAQLTARAARRADGLIAHLGRRARRDLPRPRAGARGASPSTPLGAGREPRRGPRAGAASCARRHGLGRRARSCSASRRSAPHKNQELLLRALPLLPGDARGRAGRAPEPYERAAARRSRRELGVDGPRAVRSDHVDDAELEGLWQLAACGAFPTLRRGLRAAGGRGAAARRAGRLLGHPGAARGRRRRRPRTSIRTMPAGGGGARSCARSATRRRGDARRRRARGGVHVGRRPREATLARLRARAGGGRDDARRPEPRVHGPRRDRRHGGRRARADPRAARRGAGDPLHRVREPRGGGRGPRRRRRRRARSTRAGASSGCAASRQLLPGLARRAGCELVHSLGSTAPARGRFVRVTTIHDLNYLMVPGRALRRARARDARARAARGARASHRVLADSASTRDDLVAPPAVPAAARSTSCRSASGGPAHRRADAGAGAARAPRRSATRPVAALAVGQAAAQEPARAARRAGADPAPSAGRCSCCPATRRRTRRSCARRAAALGVDDDVRFLGWTVRRGRRGPVRAERGVRLPVALRGVRSAGARGDGARRARRVLGPRLAARGRAATPRCCSTPPIPPRSPRRVERLLGDAREAERLRAAGPGAGGAVHLGAHRRADARRLRARARGGRAAIMPRVLGRPAARLRAPQRGPARELAGAARGCRGVYPRFPENAWRYFSGRGAYPYDCAVRTPLGVVRPRLWTSHDLLTVNEVFCTARLRRAARRPRRRRRRLEHRDQRALLPHPQPDVRCHAYEPVPANADATAAEPRRRSGIAGRSTRSPSGTARRGVEFGVEASGRYGGIGVRAAGPYPASAASTGQRRARRACSRASRGSTSSRSTPRGRRSRRSRRSGRTCSTGSIAIYFETTERPRAARRPLRRRPSPATPADWRTAG